MAPAFQEMTAGKSPCGQLIISYVTPQIIATQASKRSEF